MATTLPPASQPIDLAVFTAVDTFEIAIHHPAFEPGTEPVFVMAGPNHPATIRADKARQEAVLKAHGRIDAETLATDHVASRVLSWRNIVIDGKQPSAHLAEVKDLLTRPNLKWIRNQVLAALGDDESFFTV